MGDALTVALMKQRNFQAKHFARFHPGGSLGRRLLSKVSDEMVNDKLPLIGFETSIPDVIHAISDGKLGVALIKDDMKIKALITDGDLRRAIEVHGKDIFNLKAKDICTLNPTTIIPNARLQAAHELMDNQAIHCLIVQTETEFLGVIKK
jgi:arabinose-5-phosphate isomerase